MEILLAFAFLAGIFTVLSPCILPILPAILSASAAKGKLRPFAIILGLTLSFTFFTLALTSLVQATGISPQVLRYLAISMIFLFGMTMIFPQLSNWFANWSAPAAEFGEKIQPKQTSGFWGGLFFGAALGLLWTPCAGPILAAITTLVATHSLNSTAVLMTLAYSLGAAIPMFLIAYGGSRVIQSSKLLSQHAEGIRRFFGAVMLLVAVALALNWDMLLQQKIALWVPSALIEKNPALERELQKLRGEERWKASTTAEQLADMGPAPALTGNSKWINSEPLSLSDLKGKVVLVDFWTYSCINCLRTLPYIEKWYDTYKDKGLVIIGVHTPEFEFEKDSANVEAAAKRLGITYPVALDNDYATWKAYQNHYWPAHYLIDQKGHVRMIHFGEGAYVDTENAIRELLSLAPLEKQEIAKVKRPVTPETYLGSARGGQYTPQRPLADDTAGVRGEWKIDKESILSESEASYLDLNFLARQVYLVLSGSSQVPVEVTLDGKPAGTFIVDSDRKYDIVNTSYGRHQLSLKIPKGVKAYAFTFGDEDK